LPFEEPGAGTWNDGQNFGGRFSLVKELECQTTVTNFITIFLIHQTTLRVVMSEEKASIHWAFSKSVHDVVDLLLN
ncbi:MAG: hypothetical protein LC776_09460, partial [Acidobacteria bacterium]|nr:hypothetical protein [Acidobacteriota bacterium]